MNKCRGKIHKKNDFHQNHNNHHFRRNVLIGVSVFLCVLVAGLCSVNFAALFSSQTVRLEAAPENWIKDDVQTETGKSGFYDDSAGKRVIYFADETGAASIVPVSPAGVSFNMATTGSNTMMVNSSVAKIITGTSEPATKSAFSIGAVSAGKTQLSVKGTDELSSTDLAKAYDVYVQPRFIGQTAEQIQAGTPYEVKYDVSSTAPVKFKTNVLQTGQVTYYFSTKSTFSEAKADDATVYGALDTFSNSNIASTGVQLSYERSTGEFSLKAPQTVGDFYLYLELKDSSALNVCQVVCAKIVCKAVVGDIFINLDNQDHTGVKLKEIYQFEKFGVYFKKGYWNDLCEYEENTTKIASNSTNAIDKISATFICQETTDFLYKEDGSLYQQNDKLNVTIYLIDRLAFLSDNSVTEEMDVRLAKGGSASLSFVYTTATVPMWSSDDKSVVTVQNGVLNGVNPGTTKVRAKVVENGIAKEIICNVSVVATDEVLALDKSSTIENLGTDFYLVATGSAVSKARWVIADTDIVDFIESNVDGRATVGFRPKKVGTTVISIYNPENAIMASCSVKIETAPTKIAFSNNLKKIDLNMSIGTYQLSVDLTPPDPYAELVWETNDSKIATVDENGLVSLLSTGTVLVTVFPANNPNNVHASITLNILQQTEGITLDTKEASIKVGEKLKINYTVLPETASNKNITWSTMDSKIATVDKNGVVTGKTIGKTYIYAVTENGSYMGICTINVTQEVTGLKLDVSNLSLKVGDVYYVQSTFTPANATETKITWTSQNPKIASVSTTGKVTGVGAGQTTIFAKTKSGEVVYLYVTVQAGVMGLKLDKESKTCFEGKSFKLYPEFTPAEPTNSKVTWKSSNTGIATVNDKGKVVTKKAGMVIITCISQDGGYMASCAVTVKEGVSGVELDQTEVTIRTRRSVKLHAELSPEHPSSRKVTWTSSNPSVAKVSAKGKVTGLKGGTTIITCTTAVGGHKASCVVTVEQLVSYIKLSEDSCYVGLGRTHVLKATLDSNDISNKAVKWVSTNKKIATIDKNGTITGKNLGKCTIICKAMDGSKAKAKCTVQVVRQAKNLTLDRTTIRILEGKTTRIRAKITPANAGVKTVDWSSSDENIATVDTNGNIYAVAEGVCKVCATTKDDSNKKAYCYVYVLAPVPASNVVVSQKDLFLPVGDTEQLSVSLLPSGCTDSITYSSDNKLVATVDRNGRVRGLMPGQATITITSTSGKTATCTVTVLGLNRTTLSMGMYETYNLRVEGMTSGMIWESEDPNVAIVSANGMVTSRRAGTTRIVVSIKGIKLYCTVTVTNNM